ncbi:hypothetical protein Taro_047503 [Colocasia esculenta]|uniref:Uncharacterized protein n=1 Tax=Colocasia esculenta TaxID=4460 RepID=A0A843X5I2_COLES|nr:hypothetical protein [Colocasia esculenta]
MHEGDDIGRHNLIFHRYAQEYDDYACFSNKLNRGIEQMTYQIKYRIAYAMDRYFQDRIISKEIGHIRTDIMYSHGQTYLIKSYHIISNQTYHIKQRHILINLAYRISAMTSTTSPYSRG